LKNINNNPFIKYFIPRIGEKKFTEIIDYIKNNYDFNLFCSNDKFNDCTAKISKEIISDKDINELTEEIINILREIIKQKYKKEYKNIKSFLEKQTDYRIDDQVIHSLKNNLFPTFWIDENMSFHPASHLLIFSPIINLSFRGDENIIESLDEDRIIFIYAQDNEFNDIIWET